MKLAVMQPYIFPYIGYFQMISAVDKFIFYDDVNYIKQGWINRNKILVSGKDFLFTIPLTKANSFVKINETTINLKMYMAWKFKFLQTLTQSYKKAPYFKIVYDLVDTVVNKHPTMISDLAIDSVRTISNYLDLKTTFEISSKSYNNQTLERQDRLLDICAIEGADHYINAVGGQDLYSKTDFLLKGIKLDFIKSLPVKYEQFNNQFVPWLSIIDVMMFNDPATISEVLKQYEFTN